eukprot:6212288-Pleurochrysis_carterae.AAC.1
MDYVVKVGPSCRHSPSDEWEYTSHSQNDGNSTNQSGVRTCTSCRVCDALCDVRLRPGRHARARAKGACMCSTFEPRRVRHKLVALDHRNHKRCAHERASPCPSVHAPCALVYDHPPRLSTTPSRR